MKRSGSIILIATLTTFLVACIVINREAHEIVVSEVNRQYQTLSATKAHLKNGDVVVMPEGFEVSIEGIDTILIPAGNALHYNLARNYKSQISRLSKSEVAFMETYKTSLDGPSLLAGIPGTLTVAAGLAIAIFGSCPTYYSNNGEEFKLEAEGFSYSISHNFETEDLDRLKYLKPVDGEVKIQIRNEALETHYIDQLSLVSVEHEPQMQAYAQLSSNPISERKIILVEKSVQLTSAHTRDGDDILDIVSGKDNLWHRSKNVEMDVLMGDANHRDWIELEFVVPKDHREIFLTMNLRNSLLNSVFLYDVLLGSQNYGAIDWLDKSMDNWFKVLEFYKWYNSYFGMTVELLENEKYKEVHHFGDLGPISWSERALRIPIRHGGKHTIRLKYLPDNWHIDMVGISLNGQTIDHPREYLLEGRQNNVYSNPEMLDEDDGDYFIQYPGSLTELKTKTDDPTPGLQRSWFIRSKGYYTEWLRQGWLDPKEGEAFSKSLNLDHRLIRQLARTWVFKKEHFEKLFFETMIPVSQSEI